MMILTITLVMWIFGRFTNKSPSYARQDRRPGEGPRDHAASHTSAITIITQTRVSLDVGNLASWATWAKASHARMDGIPWVAAATIQKNTPSFSGNRELWKRFSTASKLRLRLEGGLLDVVFSYFPAFVPCTKPMLHSGLPLSSVCPHNMSAMRSHPPP